MLSAPCRRWALLPALLAVLLAAQVLAGPTARGAPATEALVRAAPGLRLEFAAEDRALAEQLWPAMERDRATVMERLRMFPQQELRVVLAPTLERFHALLGGAPPSGTLGVYLLGQGVIVLRSPRTAPGGTWDLRGVLRHELAHGIIDLAIAQPVPLWMHEGLAILVSDELDYLDETELTALAVLGQLIPLPGLFGQFPVTHGARTVAYAQAASFVRFLLREGGMAVLQRLLETLAQGTPPEQAFAATYGQPLEALERRWQQELAGRFSYLTLITTTTLLGGLGLPLLLLAVARRWVQRRRAYRQWELEERLRASVRGEPGNGGASPPLRDGWN
ncbi:MAG TPA: peptidase MA family metallohydrolase [bacterium]